MPPIFVQVFQFFIRADISRRRADGFDQRAVKNRKPAARRARVRRTVFIGDGDQFTAQNPESFRNSVERFFIAQRLHIAGNIRRSQFVAQRIFVQFGERRAIHFTRLFFSGRL